MHACKPVRSREREGVGGGRGGRGRREEEEVGTFSPPSSSSLSSFSLIPSAPTLPSADGSHVQPRNITTVEKAPNRWFVTGSAPLAPPVFFYGVT